MEEASTFGDQLAALYGALADADSATAQLPTRTTEATDAVSAASVVAEAFTQAPSEQRARYLLRALDDAIAALETASRLADEFHGTATRTTPPDTSDPLYGLYAAFTEGQAAFQALYHYRNALAARDGGLAEEAPAADASATSAPVGDQLPMPEETEQDE